LLSRVDKLGPFPGTERCVLGFQIRNLRVGWSMDLDEPTDLAAMHFKIRLIA